MNKCQLQSFNGVKFDIINITCGVPQGTISDPSYSQS